MKKSPWLRSYRDALHNAKLIRLSDRQFRIWQCCLWCTDDAGILPTLADLACHLRMSTVEAEQAVNDLIEARLINVSDPGTALKQFSMNGWDEHQYVGISTPRVKKFRNKNKDKNVKRDETFLKRTETPQTTESDTDTDKESNLLKTEFGLERWKEVSLNSGFSKGLKTKKTEGLEALASRAEGFGLNVDELVATLNRQKPRNRPAYFTTLCVNQLSGLIPLIPEGVIRDAMWNKQPALGLVMQAMVGVA